LASRKSRRTVAIWSSRDWADPRGILCAFQDAKDIIPSEDEIPNPRGWELSDKGKQNPERLSLSAKDIVDSIHVAAPSWTGPREEGVFNAPWIAPRNSVQDCTILPRVGAEKFHKISGFLSPLPEPLIAF
jgi:hypothetical protein